MLFPHAGAQPEIFQGRGGFVELGHFDKHFVKHTRKKDPAGKNFGVFSPQDTVKTTFRIKHLTQRWTQSGLFFQGHFFRFFKKDRGRITCLSLSLAVLCLQKRHCYSAFLY